MLGGRFVHQNIFASSPIKNEAPVGWIFHYLTGGGVALMYPAFFLALRVPVPEDHLVPGLAFGLATVVLPWFLLFPAFGWGFFGVRAPADSRPLIGPAIEHTLYGLGLGVVLNIVS